MTFGLEVEQDALISPDMPLNDEEIVNVSPVEMNQSKFKPGKISLGFMEVRV